MVTDQKSVCLAISLSNCTPSSHWFCLLRICTRCKTRRDFFIAIQSCSFLDPYMRVYVFVLSRWNSSFYATLTSEWSFKKSVPVVIRLFPKLNRPKNAAFKTYTCKLAWLIKQFIGTIWLLTKVLRSTIWVKFKREAWAGDLCSSKNLISTRIKICTIVSWFSHIHYFSNYGLYVHCLFSLTVYMQSIVF